MKKIEQIPLSFESKEEIKELVNRLVKIGYKPIHGLDNVDNLSDIVAIVVDNKKKTIHQSNVTCMACWCSSYKTKPLSVKIALSNFSELFLKQDFNQYSLLLRNGFI